LILISHYSDKRLKLVAQLIISPAAVLGLGNKPEGVKHLLG